MTARLQTNYLSRVSFAASQKRSERLEKQWQKLCAHYLPVAPADAVWRYHCIPSERDPTQGWKLHISASVLNAVAVLRKVAPVLAARGIPFKAPVTLTEVMKLNSGCDYGYSQVGKIITVYPRTSEEGVRIAKQLHELTRGMAAPSVPFDLKYCNRGNVYYRFGAFKPLEMKKETGVRTLAVVGPHGELEPDQRHNPKPDWVVTDPFAGDTQKKRSSRKDQNAFSSSYYVFRALSQRGKGGVYQALDLTV